MTLKEKYLEARRNNNIDEGFLYEYYLKNIPILCRKNKSAIGFVEFISLMQFANIERIVQNLDSEFGVNVLYSKEGRELFVV